MNTVEILVELAERAHDFERDKNHIAGECEKCLAIACANQMIREADEVYSSVTLYIP